MRPVESCEGKASALGDHHARKLLDAPQGDTLKARPRYVPPPSSITLDHALRRDSCAA